MQGYKNFICTSVSTGGKEEDSYIGNLMFWNTRTLVKDDGSIKTGRVRQSVEKKVVLMIWELKRYATFAAAISETRWLGNDIYQIENYAILQWGRQLPKCGNLTS